MIALLFARYKLPAEILVALAILAGCLYEFHEFCEREQDIGGAKVQELWDKQKLVDARALADRQQANQATVDAAVTQGVQREATIKVLAASSAAAAVSLRDAIAAINSSVPTATIETLRGTVATYGSVLGECTDRYQQMARYADQHASQQETLSDAFPTK